MQLIREYSMHEHQVAFYAEKLCISSRYLDVYKRQAYYHGISSFPQFHEYILYYILCFFIAHQAGGVEHQVRIVPPEQGFVAVSYTHLDVYKRQIMCCIGWLPCA